jgi:hypothetical protein
MAKIICIPQETKKGKSLYFHMLFYQDVLSIMDHLCLFKMMFNLRFHFIPNSLDPLLTTNKRGLIKNKHELISMQNHVFQ